MASVAGFTIADLVALLREYDGNYRVMIAGMDGGYFDLVSIEVHDICLNVNDFPGAGPHDLAEDTNEDIVKVLVLRHFLNPVDISEATAFDS